VQVTSGPAFATFAFFIRHLVSGNAVEFAGAILRTACSIQTSQTPNLGPMLWCPPTSTRSFFFQSACPPAESDMAVDGAVQHARILAVMRPVRATRAKEDSSSTRRPRRLRLHPFLAGHRHESQAFVFTRQLVKDEWSLKVGKQRRHLQAGFEYLYSKAGEDERVRNLS
jgi:hypothetical protein